MKITKKFKPGQVLDRFEVKGKKVVFRTIRLSDVEGITRSINSLIGEKAYILLQKKVSKKSEIEWVKNKIKELKENNKILVIAEVDGKIAGSAEVWRWLTASKHVSEIGIGLSIHRGIGLGTRMLILLEMIARKNFKSKLMIIKYIEGNKIALGLYKKRGFVETGRFPKTINHYGKYVDEVILSKELK